MDEHAEHHGHHSGMMMPEMAMDLTQFDGVLSAPVTRGLMPTSWRSARRKWRSGLDGDGNRSQLADSG
jgi:hypothetical protein